MAGVHVASGSAVLIPDSPVTLQIGPLTVRFSEDAPLPTAASTLSVPVPFGRGSMSAHLDSSGIQTEDGKYVLKTVFLSVGPDDGSVVSASFSLYLE